ncbi:MAG: phosphoribosylformylglycinamidine synthase subunit PurL [Bacteroidales bacterium]|nr:phosphoribosylformylglycinamidine synthase subunit PurL [Bacteroidales bacterium]MDT8431323.1 phosphoribosylformylglycinamidine synthase subunit PurL [Bacteroidales bacterium]
MGNRNEIHQQQISAFLTSDERYSIDTLLGRKPNDFELNMFAAMWSEHISYKSSVRWIEDLPVKGPNILVQAGDENAGVIDIDGDLACVIKMESHNHPTAVNPGEAAVGVGNIHRDLVAMGARPVAQLNILRFGDLRDPKIRESVKSVVRALGSYSNSFGVPVVGGEILFDDSYAYNPLLNLMAVGLVKKDRIITASFKKKGDQVVLIGRKTSGSGVHGAGFASTPFSGNTKHLVPETQLADPHSGKILCDSLMEMNEAGLISAMQDVGAGGVLCAASEMAFRGSRGVRIDVDSIPVMREDLDPIDILLSQSQEQMLISISPGNLARLREIAGKWEIMHATIGEVTDDGKLVVVQDEDKLCDLPVASLVRGGGAPVYIRDMKDPGRKVVKVSADEVPFPGRLKEVARTMIVHPNIASRRDIYEQFDTMAGLSNMGAFFPSDAGVLSIPGSKKLIALSVDGNSRYVRREPRKGTMIAVAEAARNIVCSGGKPVALANGLNFGDPGDLRVYHDFTESVKGIRLISEKMQVPVIAGNVSLNNVTRRDQTSVSVQPTPVIGMVGIIENQEDMTSISFRSKGDMIYMLGRSSNDLSGSEYLAAIHLVEETAAPEFDLDYEMQLQQIMQTLIRDGLVRSAHDVSLGGLFVALVECCLPNNLGFDITSPAEVRTDAFLFGESQSRIVVSVSENAETAFLDFMIEQKFPLSALGHVTKQELRIDDSSFGFITDYARDFENALGKLMEG